MDPNQVEVKFFVGPTWYMSNFFPLDRHIEKDGMLYPTVEHAYQSTKTLNPLQKEKIRSLPSAGMAKHYGKQVTLREDWEEIKLGVMEDLVREKFKRNTWIRGLLLKTTGILQEGNHWGDTYWGVVHGKGENHLGKILMKIREELRASNV